MKSASLPPVAVINSNEDIIDAIRLLLSEEGYSSVSAHVTDFKRGRENLPLFLSTHKPKVAIYDIAPPYEENWNFFQLIRHSQEAEGVTFILTTTHKEKLDEIAGETDAVEILGKPFDIEEIVKRVKEVK